MFELNALRRVLIINITFPLNELQYMIMRQVLYSFYFLKLNGILVLKFS